jgi:hypothetical protein
MPQQITISSTADGAIIIRGVGGTALEIVDESTPPPPPPPPDPDPEPVPSDGIWISQSEIAELPMSGAGWAEVLAAADANPGTPSLSNQDSNNSTSIMACALAYARTGEQKYLAKVVAALRTVATGNLEKGARALALGREIPGYVLAADIARISELDPALHAQLRTKFKSLLTAPCSSGPATLRESHEERPNNWGGHAACARIAIALYIEDVDELMRAAQVFKGWLGDRTTYAGFKYGELDWQADPTHPVGINPKGSTIQGHSVDGAQPEELRRAGGFQWPPAKTDYYWEGLQGPMAAAFMLDRAGLAAFEWCDRALLRSVEFAYSINWPAEGDDKWQIPLINYVYGTSFPVTGGGRGKNVGWTLWTCSK